MQNIESNFPESYIQEMKQLLGSEYEDYIQSFLNDSYVGIRVNTSKISVADFKEICPFQINEIPWTKNGFYVDKKECITKHPFYYAGLYYVQEPSAMLPASRLPIKKNDIVLDLCAAPGGKATELGSRLNNTGLLIANDISNSRAKALLKNLELFGIGNLCVCSETPEKLSGIYRNYFTKILIDAPCSGEGMFRKDPSMLKSYQEHGPEYYNHIQEEILKEAYKMLRPDGMILYSTCTFSRLENENTILHFLFEHQDMELLPMEGCCNFSSGKTDMDPDHHYHLDYCIRLFPHKIKGEGHFAALLHKKEEKETVSFDFKHRVLQPVKSLPDEWHKFNKENLRIDFTNYNFYKIDDLLYAVPEQYECPKQVRFLRTGILLGECKKKRFEPSQALAMYLKKHQVCQSLDLQIQDERVYRYLKGETIELHDQEAEKYQNAWVLVCICGFPLGWGKTINGSLKNKYYSGWRILS